VKFKLLVLVTFIISNVFSQSITINKKDAEVWSTSQTIKGRLNDFFVTTGSLFLNSTPIAFNVSMEDSSFNVPLTIGEGMSTIVAEASSILSDTLQIELAYNIRPEIYAKAEVNGFDVTFKAQTIENSAAEQLSFLWVADENNPSTVSINNYTDSIASASFSSGLPNGEFYFDVYVTTPSNDTTIARTFVTFKDGVIRPFNIISDYAAWIDSAVIYEITPYIFVNNGKFNNITSKIPDLVRLGINTIWLQPIYKTFYGGQGYDITDYFNVRSDLGTEQDLRTLIQTAKANGMKVMFDFVANHSSIQHPYAKNSTLYGTDSHYWDFYQRETNSAPYSQHYHFYQGFINYFWNDLPNLNFDNPEVQKWITEAAKYWIEKFDIDGYRFDAVWGVTARNPQFTKDLRLTLKRIKPEILMLAEDKASQDQVFDERFDVGYDWTPEEDWVSHWSWQTDYNPNANPTIFNYSNQNQRSSLLRDAMNNDGNGYADNAKILRFLDNNDMYFFITHHGIERTRMAAALLMTLNGIPLIYNGQETGKSGHPYSTEFLYYPGLPIDYGDPNNLFPYYKNLIKFRKSLPALYNNNYSEISVTPSTYVFGFRRWFEDQNIFTIMNMGSTETSVNVSIPVSQFNLDTSVTYYLTDLISGEVISGKLNELKQFSTTMPRFSSKVYLLADSILVVSVDDAKDKNNVPDKFELTQNFPNPFNPITTISFSIPSEGKVELLAYDILGREIQTLVNEIKTPGQYEIIFDGKDLSTGVYFYRLNFDGYSSVKKMLIIK
jgi:glycosidase